MTKKLNSLGLMSGTSGDGVDASIIQSDGEDKYNVIYNKYFEYEDQIFKMIHELKEKLNKPSDLSRYKDDLKTLERKITVFHAKIVKEIAVKDNLGIELVGFHGQTMYHNPEEKISKQLGDAKLLHQLLDKNIIYNFRENDLNNGGQGAPLAPIFHRLIAQDKKLDLPLCILNIGGISNITILKNYNITDLKSRDIGPGNCMIDEWVRKNSEKKYDENGILGMTGKKNEIIFEQAIELFSSIKKNKLQSLDTKDFDISFARGLSLEDGTATLTDLTSKIISSSLLNELEKIDNSKWQILLCGGGRKNKTLIEKIKKYTSNKFNIKLIDEYNINGDYVESQAFAYLAIRSYLGLVYSFPGTTGCQKACTGGSIIKI
jgi:anhydro-N-acetylmuramic acid kinase